MSRIALIGDNSIEYIEILLNIWNNGDCAVLVDCEIPFYTAVEMMREAQVCKCYVESKYYDKIYSTLDNSIELISYDLIFPHTQLLPTAIYDKFKVNYSSDEAIVIYSSGTTGESKGIILSYFAINTNSDAIINYMQPSESDCMYIVKKLTHSSTIIGELMVALKMRTPILIAPVVVPPRYVFSNIAKYNVTIIGVNPLLLSMFCNEYQYHKQDLSSLKKIFVSGSILSDRTYAIAHEVFNKQEIYNVYGLSEAGPRVAAQRYDCCKSNSVGKAINNVNIAIVDENGNVSANGALGIIHVESPCIFNGYIQGELKNKSLYNNWLNTGDIGFFDENDELHIIGRVDEMIVIGAHKIYPSEVERQIQVFSEVIECIVFMVNYCKEELLCCLYVSCKSIRTDIKKLLGTVLMKHEIPKLFVKIDVIPRTPNGKIDLKKSKQLIINRLKGE